MGVATRHANKYSNQLAIRLAALRLAATVVEALGPDVRTALGVQVEALKLIDRHSKVRTESVCVPCHLWQLLNSRLSTAVGKSLAVEP